MVRVKPFKKLRLHAFNNLTKSLSFNLYDVCYAKSGKERSRYLAYIDEEYNAERLTQILTDVTNIIGANILNTARQDYEPQGASVTMLISEEPVTAPDSHGQPRPLVGDRTAEAVVNHLDTSHLCVHTYPEYHPADGICTFRADIEVSTCGRISPLHALNHLIREFDSDVINIDYRVRGFTRDIAGRKHYIDHKIASIQDFIDKDLLRNYQAIDVNVYQERLFHSKLMWKKVDLERYLLDGRDGKEALKPEQRRRIKRALSRELHEIFEGQNWR